MAIMAAIELAVVVVILLVVLRIAMTASATSNLIDDLRKALLPENSDRPGRLRSWGGHVHRMAEGGYFTIWEWRDNQWELKSAVMPPGFEPPSPPQHPGAFEGEHRKQWVPESRS